MKQSSKIKELRSIMLNGKKTLSFISMGPCSKQGLFRPRCQSLTTSGFEIACNNSALGHLTSVSGRDAGVVHVSYL